MSRLLHFNFAMLRLATVISVIFFLVAVSAVSAQLNGSDDFVVGPMSPDQLAPDQLTPGQLNPNQSNQLNPEQISPMSADMGAQEQFQELCARAAAKRLSDDDIQNLAAAKGLSPDEVERLRECSHTFGQSNETPPRYRQPSMTSQFGPMQQHQQRKSSAIERDFRSLASPFRQPVPPSPEHLEQFGYSVFSQRISTFAPATNVPVSADYILGPGDSLTVLFWGRLNQTFHLPIERDGTVSIPRIGPIAVAGLTFDQAKKLLESRAGQMEGVQVNVTMGAIRTIQVFVMGKVNQPGLYTVSALSHVSNALVAAGGISKVGSLRKVELRRENQIVQRIDLYNMLLHGDSSGDVRVEPRDVIFVPVIGSVVGVTGDVKSPGIYELAGESSLRSVLNLAGGVNAFGYGQRTQVERVEDHQRRIALDVDLDGLGRARFAMRDGDLVEVFPVLPQQKNVVVLKGNVSRPGSYEWRQGMRVSDLIREAEGISDHTYLEYAGIRRRVSPSERIEYLPVDLGAALQSNSSTFDVELAPRDELTVYSENDLNDVPTVTVRGWVRKPGTYPLTQGMRLSDLIYEAGGLKDDAFRKQGTLARTEVVDGGTTRHLYINVDIASALKMDGTDDPELHRYDQLYVQQASNWHKPWEVRIRGQVERPGPYVIHEGERLSELIRDAGGLRPDAYPSATVFERRWVKEAQQKVLDESRARLSQDLVRVALTPEESGGQQADKATSVAMVEKMLQETGRQEAVGRLALNISSLDSLVGSPSDLILQNDDEIVVPRKPSSVNVLGQVYNPIALVYEPDLRVKDYLQRAGGVSETGDADHVFVIKANGSILTDEGYKELRKSDIFPAMPLISGGLLDAYLEPGDTLFVPWKLVYVNNVQQIKDITTIFANTAQGFAIIGLLASQL